MGDSIPEGLIYQNTKDKSILAGCRQFRLTEHLKTHIRAPNLDFKVFEINMKPPSKGDGVPPTNAPTGLMAPGKAASRKVPCGYRQR